MKHLASLFSKAILLKIIASLLFAFNSYASDMECNDSCKITQIESYFSLLDKISRKGSTEQDVDALLAQVHTSVQYQHPGYGADFNQQSWRDAFLRNLSRGAYNKTAGHQARILNVIHGKNHTAIEYSHGEVDTNGTWQPGKAYFALFEFTEGKISLVREYW